MRALLASGIMLLLVGCVATPPEEVSEAAAAEGAKDPLDATDFPWTFTEQFTLTVNQVRTPISTHVFSGPNCIHLEGPEPWSVESGTATATWTSPAPVADELRVFAVRWSDGERIAEATGSPPLELAIPATGIEEEFLLLGVDRPGPVGAAYGQEVTLDLALQVVGAFEVSDSTCAVG